MHALFLQVGQYELVEFEKTIRSAMTPAGKAREVNLSKTMASL
jgi:hypothetical protein